MLFHSSLRKELARHFGATLVVLVTVVMTMMLIRTLGIAAQGGVNPQEVMMVMAYMVLGHMPTILTLALFIAIVSTLSRLFADSEMVVWFASGAGLARFVKPLMRFAWPVLLSIAALALIIWPWANQQSYEMRGRYEKRGDLERVAPGQFQESANGDRVFFIDKDAVQGQSGRNVFIASNVQGRHSVTTARAGRVDVEDGERYLVLSNGQQLEASGSSGQALKISDFEEYRTRIGKAPSNAQDDVPVKAQSTLALLRAKTPEHMGELAWRLGLAFASFNFVLLALVLSYTNPRSGRSLNLLMALFTFVIYYNLINLGQSWIAAGKVQTLPFLLVLHGGALALSLAWLALRHQAWTWRTLLRTFTRHRPGMPANPARGVDA
jgi:lipopolysaccharide export system permease protein